MHAIEDYEENTDWSWSFVYKWKINPDNTRSLWCMAQVNPEDIECALAQKSK
ncbi:MAG TPA: hypothetical protein VGW78_06220 [Candidatus Babeliales bacterium]|jgi:hypothetical protein|nr:hypothetical protein [Candidatus Babeliales bacterium]